MCFEPSQFAAHNHLRAGGRGGKGGRGGESILPLPQPASFSDAEITLRNLVQQHKTWTACSTFRRKQGRQSGIGWSWPVSPDVRKSAAYWQRVMVLLQWLVKKCIDSLQVPSSSCRPIKKYNSSYAPHVQGRRIPQNQSERSPVVTEQWRCHKRQQNCSMKHELHSSPSVRPSPKAIDYARDRKPWTQFEGDSG